MRVFTCVTCNLITCAPPTARIHIWRCYICVWRLPPRESLRIAPDASRLQDATPDLRRAHYIHITRQRWLCVCVPSTSVGRNNHLQDAQHMCVRGCYIVPFRPFSITPRPLDKFTIPQTCIFINWILNELKGTTQHWTRSAFVCSLSKYGDFDCKEL